MEKNATRNSSIEQVHKTVAVVDLDADDDMFADAIEVYGLSKDHGWLLMMRVDAKELSFDPQSTFYHRVFKIVKSGQRPQVNEAERQAPIE